MRLISVETSPPFPLPPPHTPQCNLGTVSGGRSQSQPCPKIDTDRAKKEQAKQKPALAGASGGFRWPWQAKA